jgi:predicted negative regulator of RcsB-dependent stress response
MQGTAYLAQELESQIRPMKLWLRYSSILLLTQVALLGQTAKLLPQLEKKATTALAAGLWEIAEQHFQTALRDASLTPETKSRLTLRLAETLIRSGQVPTALDLLNEPLIRKNPESSFWKAQALLTQSRYSEAATLLSALLAETHTPYRAETGLTLASVQLALGKPDDALTTLGLVQPSPDAALQLQIQLYQVEILLDLGRTQEAEKLMPQLEKIPAEKRTAVAFLKAKLTLLQKKFPEAQAAYQALITHLQGPELTHTQAATAAIGLAEALNGQGDSSAALNTLISFLQENPDTKLLESIFYCIIQWLPEKPLANDPTLARISQWISPSTLPATDSLATGFAETGAAAAWPIYIAASESTERMIYSLFARAIGLHKIDQADAKNEGKRILNRIRVEHPNHPLASHALYHLARWDLDEGKLDQAFSTLNTLRESESLQVIKGQASLLEARTAYTAGNTQQAIQLFDEAAATLTGQLADSSKRQSVFARLRQLQVKGAASTPLPDATTDPEMLVELELERAFYTTPAAASKSEIEQFLKKYPNHPRAPEARLAAVEATLSSTEPDLEFATAQLELLTESQLSTPTLSAPRISFARLQLADFSKNIPATLTLAKSIMVDYPDDQAAKDAALILGRTFFQSRSYNDARLVLEKLAATDSDSERAQAAWLLAANSAALGGTLQSKEAALILFDKAILPKGNLSTLATLQKAEQLIDMKRFSEASILLDRFTKTLAPTDPTQLPAGMLLGKALYAQGASTPASLVQALAVYDQLVTHTVDQPIWLNRLQYLRGLTLEQLPDPKNPSLKQDGKALQAYLSVMEISGQPLEWEYFELCGFRALSILVKSERWQAAISVAKKIASFKGPNADDAALRASELELKHPNW